MLALLSTSAWAQTTVSGTVYMPNGTNVLPNALVYLTTGIPAPLVSGANCPGANCLTAANAIPSGTTAHTYTAVDGTFTLSNVPANTYVLVIQAGHWRRQFPQVVGSTAVSGLSLNMPSTHAQGDIPLIAVNTGAADAVECVFRHLGLSDNEITDSTVTTGAKAGGRIHLYKGNFVAGAEISASTPLESDLMGGTSTVPLNSYDIVMFPCQGAVNSDTQADVQSLLTYTSAGGRAFITHDSRDWLNNVYIQNGASFSGVANWLNPVVSVLNPDPGVGTINTDFPSGATLAQWIHDAGYSSGNTGNAADSGTLGQIAISKLRWDIDSINAPTQTWLTLNPDVTTSTNPVMQFSFNAPFGAAASAQYGRVMFNEYHVENVSTDTGDLYPAECPTLNSSQTAQEKMLEYALFDLSNFVTPVVAPTVSIAITTTPANSIFNEGDTTDAVTVAVTNTSGTIAIDSSAVLSVVLPTGLTATAVTDASGGWICNVGTLMCTRTTSLAAGASDSIVITVSVAGNATGGAASTTPNVSATVSSPVFSSSVSTPLTITLHRHAAVTWTTPAAVAYGTALSSTQLNAAGNAAGTLVYSSVSGTVLSTGSHLLSVTFTPTDAAAYPGTATTTVTLVVNPPPPATVTLGSLAQTYTGSPRAATATTTGPTGLTVLFSYSGLGSINYGPSATAPTLAGSYAVTGTVSDATYSGSGSGTLVIAKATAPVTLSNLTQTYTGSPLPATVVTAPVGLTVPLSYTGLGGIVYGPSATAPTLAGSYTVSGTVNDANYGGSGSGTLVIAKAAATVTISNLAQTYTGSPLPATVASFPIGLTIPLSYTGIGGTVYGPSSTPPTLAGSYGVTGTVIDANYSGTGSGTLVIAKAAATVTLGNLAQTYTGSPLAAASATAPAGLTVTLTYTGINGTAYGPSSTPPSAVGSYLVNGTIVDPTYSGTASGTLVINPSAATITLGNLAQTYTGSPLAATAVTSPAGLAVSFTYTGTGGTVYGPSSTPPTLAGSYSVTGTTGSAMNPATATGTLVIAKAPAVVTLSNLSQSYTGAPLGAMVTTSPGGLTVGLTYNGSATLPTAAGSYAVVASVSDANYSGSTAGTLVIRPAGSSVSLASSINPVVVGSAVTFTATISSAIGRPSGEVEFRSGTAVLGRAVISGGVATLTTSTLPIGMYTVTAAYAGDTNFSSSVSAPLTQAVLDFTLAPTSGAGTVPTQTASPGGVAAYQLTIVPTAGTIFPNPVTLTVTGMPAGATAAVAPALWTQLSTTSWSYPAATPINDLSLKVQLPASSALNQPVDRPERTLPPVLWAVLLLPIARGVRRMRGRLRHALFLVLWVAAGIGITAGLSGCGATSGLYDLQEKVYTITVTATSGTLVHSTQLTLTVKQ